MGDDDEGFASWYRAEHPRLLAVLSLAVGDVHVAREAVDEALARALLHWGRVARMRSPSGWAYTVALNHVRRMQRRSARERLLLRRTARPGEVVAPAGEAWTVVVDLPLRQRTAVVLRYVADLTEAEVAAAMGVSRSTVSSTLRDAHRSLAERLGEPQEQET